MVKVGGGGGICILEENTGFPTQGGAAGRPGGTGRGEAVGANHNKQPQQNGGLGGDAGRGAQSFVARVSHLTIGHESLSRRSTEVGTALRSKRR